ncbi:hypothetical protein CTAYLR_002393 [Chrysophaeum taylorii]|uniref:Nucleoplasmin-like domain-containing protein n=1 Tax=Chrysophaeum taylorii TaxID=2483200 RepID=A0AAD7UHV4_9STRA|nr:hypothetical protein CTAYLR_002393 [Chrysophaeum taylorii]
MASFWGCEVSSATPFIHEPDAVGELQLTSVVLVNGKGKTSLTIQASADDGKEFALCNLTSGSLDQAKLDLLLGAGNEKVTFRVKGDKAAMLHLTGYLVVPEEYGMVGDEPAANKVKEDEETELAKTVFGKDRVATNDDEEEEEDVEEEDDDDEMDGKAEKKAAAKLFGAKDDDDDDDDDDDEDDEDDEDDDDEFGLKGLEDDDDAVQEDDDEEEEAAPPPPKKKKAKEVQKKAEPKKSPEPAAKKRKAGEDEPKSEAKKKVKTPKPAASSKTATTPKSPEDAFKTTLVQYLSGKGTSPLSKVGNDCKKPAEVKYVCGPFPF